MHGTLLCAAALSLALVSSAPRVHAQTYSLPDRRCPSDNLPTRTDQGVTFQGTPARAYVEGFLAGDPDGDSRVSTGTTALNASMIAILSDVIEADRTACSRLNHFMSNGESALPSPPWVYFRAGNFYFVTRWTEPAVSGGRFQTGYGSIMVFDGSFNLLGVWTA